MMSTHASAAWERVQLAAGLADQKEDHYRLLLAFSALLELLAEKGVVSLEELKLRAAQLDAEPPALSAALPRPME